MSRLFAVVAVAAACSSKHEPPKPAPAAATPQPAVAPVQHFGFVPDVIAARLGHSRGVAALDMRAFKADPLLALIPEPFACARDLVKYMGVAVIAVDERDRFTMYATQDAHDWVEDVVTGFKNGAKRRHFAVDDSWFHITDSGLSSTLDLRLPLSAISGATR